MPSLPEQIAHREVTDADVRRSYALDATVALAPPPDDFTVVRARDLSDVVAVLEHAQATGTAVVPQGARTSRSGGAVATEDCIVLNVEALDAVHEVNELEGYAVVGPGVVNADLKRAAASAGLFYGPDPASWETCTIGGNIATNAGGLCCVKYGVTTDYVLGLEVVLADGTLVTLGGKRVKDVAGLPLLKLFVGSEGTLGIVTRATLRLVPAQAPRSTVVATFPTVAAAAAAVIELGRTVRASLVELMDHASINAVEDFQPMGLDREIGRAHV